ncbi:hypothetical protein [Pseudomonas sp. 5P_3.1_Bac2]|uniref:hypothetical protein n=1 Tax=Pseudomonas sp. 5P_3.1_Bac2 TaxID=2971617 RepID=UPI0021C5CC5F|nr:hypothetical protein [Pseudomonas sp. 5P_3.1_Bac2]MCU1718854.1 hypothetical protein [Pseudomonas sp. 5P_3.1_Bac2]
MNWLQRTKPWLTLIDAATYLADKTGVRVDEADLLLLATEGKLRISARFTAPVSAVVGTIIEPFSDGIHDFVEEEQHPLSPGIEGTFELRIIDELITTRLNSKGEIESRVLGLEFNTSDPKRVVRINTLVLPPTAHWVIETSALLAFTREHGICNADNLPEIAGLPSKTDEEISPVSGENDEPYVPKYICQETAILDALHALGYIPENLPKNIPGRPGIKRCIWEKLASRRDLFSDKTFNKAWERLRSDKRIADKGSAITTPK